LESHEDHTADDDELITQLKREAERQGKTMSELVETALRNLFRARRSTPQPPSHCLPSIAAAPWSMFQIAIRSTRP
jgi:hypothetical protein